MSGVVTGVREVSGDNYSNQSIYHQPSRKEANNRRLKVSQDILISLAKEKHKTKNFPDKKDQMLG